MARFILLMAFTFSPLAFGSSPTDLLIGLLKEIDFLSARYEQLGQPTAQSGQFWLSRPDRFRLRAFAPVSQTIVSDGQNLWTYDLDLEQVVITPLQRDSGNIPLLLFASNPEKLKTNYDIEYFEDEDRQHFVLSPLDHTDVVGKISLSFSGKLPDQLVFQTPTQEVTVFKFHNVSTVPIESVIFNFEIPHGIDVIDDRRRTD